MKASELRIGNYILADTLDGLFMPHFVVGGDILAIQNDELPCETKPIPITPEILGKCGFRFDGDWNYQNGNLVLHDMTDTSIKCFEVYWQYPKDIMVVGNFLTIQHLHQLQNLYFALTGEELVITL